MRRRKVIEARTIDHFVKESWLDDCEMRLSRQFAAVLKIPRITAYNSVNVLRQAAPNQSNNQSFFTPKGAQIHRDP